MSSQCLSIKVIDTPASVPGWQRINGYAYLDTDDDFNVRASKKLEQLEIGQIEIESVLGFSIPGGPLNDLILMSHVRPNVIDNDFAITGKKVSNRSKLDGFTVTGGHAGTKGGGGIYNYKSSPVIRNVKFIDNHSDGDGGAIFNRESVPALTTLSFTGNTATGKGGAVVVGAVGKWVTRSLRRVILLPISPVSEKLLTNLSILVSHFY